jgi:hypothetical protein
MLTYMLQFGSIYLEWLKIVFGDQSASPLSKEKPMVHTRSQGFLSDLFGGGDDDDGSYDYTTDNGTRYHVDHNGKETDKNGDDWSGGC